MSQKNQNFEWHITEDSSAANQAASPPKTQDRSSKLPSFAQVPRPSSRLYELILLVALLYGVAFYLLWEQAERRIVALESEMTALREGLVRRPAETASDDVTSDGSPTATTPSTLLQEFETTYLHFRVTARDANIVRQVARHSDAKYRWLHRQFRLPLPETGAKPTVVVGSSSWKSEPDLDAIVIAPPESLASYYDVEPEEALKARIGRALSEYVFDKLVETRDVKRKWQTMVGATNLYLQREHGYVGNWREEPIHLLHRRHAQDFPIQLVNWLDPNMLDQQVAWLETDTSAISTADTIAEFLIETYGYDRVPLLLDAFEIYDDWDGVASVVFKLSATELESQWHMFLKERYP